MSWAAKSPIPLPSVGANSQPGGLAPSGKELHPGTFVLPEYMGRVKDAWSPAPAASDTAAPSTPGAEPRTIIHIQDAHCNYAAQHKIADIIDYLHKNYRIDTVNLEGGAREYDLSIFTRIYDPITREKVADSFVREGLVNGAEYYAINNPEKVRLWGVEEVTLYLENLTIYRDSLKHKDEVDRALKSLGYILTNLKRHIYSSALLDLDTKYAQYKAGNLDFKDYLGYLVLKAKEANLNIKDYPAIFLLNQTLDEEARIDFKSANNQRDALIDSLQKKLSKKALEELVLRTVEFKAERISPKEFYAFLIQKAKTVNTELSSYPELQKYVVYISMYQAIDKAKIIDEVNTLEDALKEALYRNDKERALATLSKNLVLLKNIFAISLTKDDYRYYRENEDSFAMERFTAFIDKEAPLYKIDARPDAAIVNIDRYREDIATFYDCSLKRDDAFMKNMRYGEPESALPQPTTGQRPKAAIIVTGGFHTENLLKLFKEEKIAYISIMPSFRNDEGYECPYFGLLAGELTGIEKRLYSVIKTAAPAIPGMSAIQIFTMLSASPAAADIWGRADLDAFRASVVIGTEIARDRKIIVTYGGQEFVFGDETSANVETMTLRELLYQIHNLDNDREWARGYANGYVGVDQTIRDVAAQRITGLAAGVGGALADRLRAVAAQIVNGMVPVNLVDCEAAFNDWEHAGGMGIHINRTLINKEFGVDASPVRTGKIVDLIVHAAVGGITGDDRLALIAEEARTEAELAAAPAKIAQAGIDPQATVFARAVWTMTPEERAAIDRDYASLFGRRKAPAPVPATTPPQPAGSLYTRAELTEIFEGALLRNGTYIRQLLRNELIQRSVRSILEGEQTFVTTSDERLAPLSDNLRAFLILLKKIYATPELGELFTATIIEPSSRQAELTATFGDSETLPVYVDERKARGAKTRSKRALPNRAILDLMRHFPVAQNDIVHISSQFALRRMLAGKSLRKGSGMRVAGEGIYAFRVSSVGQAGAGTLFDGSLTRGTFDEPAETAQDIPYGEVRDTVAKFALERSQETGAIPVIIKIDLTDDERARIDAALTPAQRSALRQYDYRNSETGSGRDAIVIDPALLAAAGTEGALPLDKIEVYVPQMIIEADDYNEIQSFLFERGLCTIAAGSKAIDYTAVNPANGRAYLEKQRDAAGNETGWIRFNFTAASIDPAITLSASRDRARAIDSRLQQIEGLMREVFSAAVPQNDRYAIMSVGSTSRRTFVGIAPDLDFAVCIKDRALTVDAARADLATLGNLAPLLDTREDLKALLREIYNLPPDAEIRIHTKRPLTIGTTQQAIRFGFEVRFGETFRPFGGIDITLPYESVDATYLAQFNRKMEVLRESAFALGATEAVWPLIDEAIRATIRRVKVDFIENGLYKRDGGSYGDYFSPDGESRFTGVMTEESVLGSLYRVDDAGNATINRTLLSTLKNTALELRAAGMDDAGIDATLVGILRKNLYDRIRTAIENYGGPGDEAGRGRAIEELARLATDRTAGAKIAAITPTLVDRLAILTNTAGGAPAHFAAMALPAQENTASTKLVDGIGEAVAFSSIRDSDPSTQAARRQAAVKAFGERLFAAGLAKKLTVPIAPGITREVIVDTDLVSDYGLTDAELGALIAADLARLKDAGGRIEHLPATLVITFLDTSSHLFEDHSTGGFIGINRSALKALDTRAQPIILRVGLAHELAHELTGTDETPAFEEAQLGRDAHYALDLLADASVNTAGLTVDGLRAALVGVFTVTTFAEMLAAEDLIRASDRSRICDLPNDQRFTEDLVDALTRAAETRGTASGQATHVEIAAVSIQNFKEVFNDKGHVYGDLAIAAVAEGLRRHLAAAGAAQGVTVRVYNRAKDFLILFEKTPDSFDASGMLTALFAKDTAFMREATAAMNTASKEIMEGEGPPVVFGPDQLDFYGSTVRDTDLPAGAGIETTESAWQLFRTALLAAKYAQIQLPDTTGIIDPTKPADALANPGLAAAAVTEYQRTLNVHRYIPDATIAQAVKDEIAASRKSPVTRIVAYSAAKKHPLEAEIAAVELLAGTGEYEVIYRPITETYRPGETYAMIAGAYRAAVAAGNTAEATRLRQALFTKMCIYELMPDVPRANNRTFFFGNDKFAAVIDHLLNGYLADRTSAPLAGTFRIGGDELGHIAWNGSGRAVIYRFDANNLSKLNGQLGVRVGDRVIDEMIRLIDTALAEGRSDVMTYVFRYFRNENPAGQNLADVAPESRIWLTEKEANATIRLIDQHNGHSGDYIARDGDRYYLKRLPPVYVPVSSEIGIDLGIASDPQVEKDAETIRGLIRERLAREEVDAAEIERRVASAFTVNTNNKLILSYLPDSFYEADASLSMGLVTLDLTHLVGEKEVFYGFAQLQGRADTRAERVKEAFRRGQILRHLDTAATRADRTSATLAAADALVAADPTLDTRVLATLKTSTETDLVRELSLFMARRARAPPPAISPMYDTLLANGARDGLAAVAEGNPNGLYDPFIAAVTRAGAVTTASANAAPAERLDQILAENAWLDQEAASTIRSIFKNTDAEGREEIVRLVSYFAEGTRAAKEVVAGVNDLATPRYVLIDASNTLCSANPALKTDLSQIAKIMRNQLDKGYNFAGNVNLILCDDVASMETHCARLANEKVDLAKDCAFIFDSKNLAGNAFYRDRVLANGYIHVQAIAPAEGSGYFALGNHIALALGAMEIARNTAASPEYVAHVMALAKALTDNKTQFDADYGPIATRDAFLNMFKEGGLKIFLPSVKRVDVNEIKAIFKAEQAMMKSL